VALSVMLGHYLGTPILRDAVIGAFVISESLSVIENAAAMDIIVPEALKDILAQSKPEKFK